MNLFEYRVEYYDDIDANMLISYGYLIAENYAEAVRILTDWYGENDIESLKLDFVNDKALITVDTMTNTNDIRPAIMSLINAKNTN